MISEIAAGFSSLNAAKSIIQGLDALRTEEQLRDTRIKLQGMILDAQQGLFAAQQDQATATARIKELETELARLNEWNAEKERYERADAGQGAVAVRIKSGMEMGEPPYWLCPNCYEDRKRTILQPVKHPGLTESLDCPRCRTRLVVRGRSDNLGGLPSGKSNR